MVRDVSIERRDASEGIWIGKKESWSWSQALYFAFITATTVGYGDLHPTRHPSRISAPPAMSEAVNP